MEINSEIRGHLPVWRQKLLNILEEVEQERKAKENRKTRTKSETEPSENYMAVRKINKKFAYKAVSDNVCRSNIKIAGRRLIVARKYDDVLAEQTNGLGEDY